jgi:hypothetical protein
MGYDATRSTRSGCPQWEVPRVGTPAPGRCRQLGYTGEAEWCPDASSQGDARAAERAHTGGAKTAACRGQRISTPLEKSAHGLRSGGIGSST